MHVLAERVAEIAAEIGVEAEQGRLRRKATIKEQVNKPLKKGQQD